MSQTKFHVWGVSLLAIILVNVPTASLASVSDIPPGAEALKNPNTAEQIQNIWQDIVEFFGFGDQPSKWEDVKSWKAVGNRFAAGYGDDGSLLAIYDLSYPQLLSAIPLGQIGDPAIGPETLMDAWKQAQQTATDIPAYIQNAINALGSLPETVMNQDVFPAEWWKDVPWANTSFFAGNEPHSFRLTDLDTDQLNLNGQFVSSLRQLFEAIAGTTDALSGVSDQDILGAFRFEKAKEGGYNVFWDFPAISSLESVSKPRKLLDFKNTRAGMYDNIRFEALVEGLSEAADYIPVPVVQAIVATAISKLAHFCEMTQIEHLEMLHELTLDGSDPVLASLGDDAHAAFVDAFELTRTTPTSGWQWIFGSTASAWDKDLSKSASCSEASEAWLTARGDQLDPLTPSFVIAKDTQSHDYLYLASQQAPKGDIGPVLSIDYQSPSEIRDNRIFMELVDTGVVFASHFVPTAGGLVTEGYNWLVENRIDTTQYWEARLTQYLEQRPDSSNWQNDLAILEEQRINPFEISRAQMDQLILQRRQLLGL